MFSVDVWDGLAKIGKYKANDKILKTPTIFPVVDPVQQSIPIQEFKDKFRFNQVMTSAYLMSKRIGSVDNWDSYPNIADYLNFDGLIMMDSGAYQMMVYGDIELSVTDTLKLQKSVSPDIGVIMDHPIGYQVSHQIAKARIENTLKNIEISKPFLEDHHVNWALPIQGGKYIDLLTYYIDKINSNDILPHFSMYALGSVVPVMIKQDYETLVKMIATTKSKLPVTYPLHLFGAGHPAMFALATFLGCDTFDSAAYSLMAKDERYLTEYGTYDLADLTELPCSCPVCSSFLVKEMQEQEREKRVQLLQEHNLWSTKAELKRIRVAIEYGRLWDLVQQRSNTVPKLAKATKLAFDYVTTGKLAKIFSSGTPISRAKSIRISNPIDLHRPEIERIKHLAREYISSNIRHQDLAKLIVIGYTLEKSLYRRFPENQLKKVVLNSLSNGIQILFWLPPFGFIPYGLNEIFPVGQSVHDLNITDFDLESQLSELLLIIDNFKAVTILLPSTWPESVIAKITTNQKIELVIAGKMMSALLAILSDK